MLIKEIKIVLEKIAEGDSQVENDLFIYLIEKIRFMVRVRLKGKICHEDQQDIVSEIQQAVLLNLRKNAFNPERGKSLEAYVVGIANNIIGQYFRKLKNIKELGVENMDDFTSEIRNDLSDILEEERRIKLQKYLSRLKPKYREILLLRFYEKRSIEDISNLLKLERKRVSERINYAIKLIIKICKKDNYFQYFNEYHK